MKTILIALMLAMPVIGRAQSQEAQQLLLNIEKLRQFKSILADMKRGYEILNGGYGTVRDLSEGNFRLHKGYLDGLLGVSPSVRNYRKVAAIIDCQAALVREYKRAAGRFSADRNLRPDELGYIERVYGRLLRESARNTEELFTVVTAGQLRMTDGERIEQIDRIYEEVVDKLLFLRNFNNRTTVLSLQRERQRKDAEGVGKMYGLN